jgi:hypothetical protein
MILIGMKNAEDEIIDFQHKKIKNKLSRDGLNLDNPSSALFIKETWII